MWVHSMHVCVPERSFLCSCVWCQCVYIHMCMCGPAWPAQPVSPTLHVCGEQHWMCVRACSQNIMQNSLASHSNLKQKKSHSQEGTLKYQVLIWQIQATGVFTFQRLRGEKDQMPPLSSSAAASIEASLTSPWVTDLCVCVCVSHGRRKGIERAMCKVIKHHMTTCSRET